MAQQQALIDTLVDPRSFDPGAVVAAGPLAGVDAGVLSLVARFSHNKRITKLEGMLPATCALLAGGPPWDRAFAAEHPPRDARNVVNALQFYRFLLRRWRRDPPAPACLPDVAYCEVALVMLTESTRPPAALAGPDLAAAPPDAMVAARRTPGARLRATTTEVRRLVARAPAAPDPEPDHVVVARSRRTDRPEVFSVPPEAFALVGALGTWTDLGRRSDLADAVVASLVTLESYGIVELTVRPVLV